MACFTIEMNQNIDVLNTYLKFSMERKGIQLRPELRERSKDLSSRRSCEYKLVGN